MDTLLGGEKIGLRVQNRRPSSLGGFAKFKARVGNLVISCLKIKKSKQTNKRKEEDGAEVEHLQVQGSIPSTARQKSREWHLTNRFPETSYKILDWQLKGWFSRVQAPTHQGFYTVF